MRLDFYQQKEKAMVRIGASIFLCLMFFGLSAYAQGPIVFGEERMGNLVIHCFTLEDAKALAEAEKNSIAAGETFSQYSNGIRYLFLDGSRCGEFALRYIPLELIDQWTGWSVDARNTETPWAMLKSVTPDGTEVYVITDAKIQDSQTLPKPPGFSG